MMGQNLRSQTVNRPRVLQWILLGCILPLTLSANAGTPLMWAGALHLTLGNLVIGLLEGGLLIYWLGLRQRYFWCALGGMIVANYASSWAAYLILSATKGAMAWMTLLWLKPFFLICLAASFLLSLLIEWPLVGWILRHRSKSWQQALLRTFQLHAISYPMLVAYYFPASGISFMTQLDLVDVSDLKPSKPCTVYYLTIDGASVMRSEIGNERAPEGVHDLDPNSRHDRLFIRSGEDSFYDLWLLKGGAAQEQEAQLILSDIADEAILEDPRKVPYPHLKSNGFPMPPTTDINFGEVPSLWSEALSAYRTGFWPIEGLSSAHNSGEGFHVALETPFLAWTIRNAFEIDEDLLLFQLGPHQICLLHPPTHRLAFLHEGKGPVVVASR